MTKRGNICKATLLLFTFKKVIRVVIIALSLVLVVGCYKRTKVITGYIEGRLSFISSQRSGSLVKLFVDRGDAVVVGQKLFMLEERPESDIIKQTQAEISGLLAKKEQAKVNLEQAVRVLERREILARNRVVSQEDLDINTTAKKNASEELNSVNAELETAYAKLDEAKWNKEKKLIAAEKPGLVFDTYFLPTEFVPTGSPVMSILSSKDKYIVFYIPERLLHKFKVHQDVTVTCDNAQKPFQAKVSFIYPKVEFAPPILYTDKSRTSLVYKAEADISDSVSNNCLHVGQPVDIALPAGS